MGISGRATLAAVALAMALAPAAARAVTIGSLDLPAGGLGSFCNAQCTAFQGQVAPATQPRYTLRGPG